MSKYIVQVDDAVKSLLEVSNILNQLMFHTDKWEGEYGDTNKANKKYWQKKAREWILKNCIKVDD